MLRSVIIFTLQTINVYERPEDIFRSDWIMILVITPIFLYAVLTSLEHAPAYGLARIFFRYSNSNSAFRNRLGKSLFSSSLLSIISIISISTFLYFTELHFNLLVPGIKGWQMWLINLGFLFCAILFRYVVLFITGYLTGTKELFDEYFFNISSFYKFLALPVLFINFLIPYMVLVPDIYLIILIISLMAIMLIMRLIRLFLLFIRRSFSLFYLILYLCALEITPALILYKYLAGTV